MGRKGGLEGALVPLLGNATLWDGVCGREPAFYLALPALRPAPSKRDLRGCITASCLSASPRGPNLEDLLPCSGETKAPCSQGSPWSSGGPNPFWPSLTTKGSALRISNWVCEVGPLSSALGAWMIVGRKDTKAQGPRVSLTKFILEAPRAPPPAPRPTCQGAGSSHPALSVT